MNGAIDVALAVPVAVADETERKTVTMHLDLYALEVAAAEHRRRLEARAARERCLASLRGASPHASFVADRLRAVVASVRRKGANTGRAAPDQVTIDIAGGKPLTAADAR